MRTASANEDDSQHPAPASRQELEADSRRYRDLVEHAPIGITEISLDGRLVDANPEVCALLGYEREELVGMEARALVAPESVEDRGAAIRRLLEGGEASVTYNVSFIRRDGALRDGEVVMTALRNPDGKPRSLLGIIQDCTARRELERRVSAQADLINHTHDAIFVKQLADSIITFWNPAAEQLYGYSAEDAIGRSSHDLLRTVFPQSAAAAEEQLKATGEWSGELMHLTSSGEPVWVESRWRLIRDLDGNPVSALEVNRDVTSQAHMAIERERLMEILERQNRDLRETDRLKTEFLLTISHELRTPLTAILGFSDLLAIDSSVAERDELDIIRRNGRRLLVIIEDILTLAQAQAGNLRLTPQPVNISSSVRRAADKVRKSAIEKGLTIDVYGAEEPLWVMADDLAISHVLRHLLGNAVKFTASGHVHVALAPAGDLVRVSVEDTGPGVPETARGLVFEEFRQVDQSMTREHGGVGIGLTVVRRLLDLQGGKLGLESREGGGSVFWFTLPRTEPQPG